MTADPRSPEIAIALPQTVGDGWADPAAVAGYARRAEELGFDGLWVSELLTTRVLDPLTLLAYSAAVTRRVRLGVAVVLSALRIPLQLARETATLDQLSGGRLTLGVGLGSNRAVYPAYGLSPRGRVERFDEGLGLLKDLWAGEAVVHGGQAWQLDGTQSSPRPVQQPHPPLLFGARSVPGLRRAVLVGNGWIGSGSEPIDGFAAQVDALGGLLDEAGRDPAGFVVGKRVYVAVDDDQARARQRVRAWFGANYGKPELGDVVAVVGTAERCARALDRIRRSGAQLLVLNPMFDEPEQMEAIAADVVPLIAAASRSTEALGLDGTETG